MSLDLPSVHPTSKLAVDIAAIYPRGSNSSSVDSSLEASPTTGNFSDVTPTAISSTPAFPDTRIAGGILVPRARTTSLHDLRATKSMEVVPPLPMPLPNVKFAPLPELAPRKRKSTAPLGVAARGELMRRRRQVSSPATEEAPDRGSPMWTSAEMNANRRRQRGEEAEMEDPFLMFGRMVKRGWKKMANKDGAKDAEVGNGEAKDAEPRKSTKASVVVTGQTRGLEAPLPPLPHEKDGDHVWEGEAENPNLRLHIVGQTETISEDNSQYPWSQPKDIGTAA